MAAASSLAKAGQGPLWPSSSPGHPGEAVDPGPPECAPITPEGVQPHPVQYLYHGFLNKEDFKFNFSLLALIVHIPPGCAPGPQ